MCNLKGHEKSIKKKKSKDIKLCKTGHIVRKKKIKISKQKYVNKTCRCKNIDEKFGLQMENINGKYR